MWGCKHLLLQALWMWGCKHLLLQALWRVRCCATAVSGLSLRTDFCAPWLLIQHLVQSSNGFAMIGLIVAVRSHCSSHSLARSGCCYFLKLVVATAVRQRISEVRRRGGLQEKAVGHRLQRNPRAQSTAGRSKTEPVKEKMSTGATARVWSLCYFFDHRLH